MGICDDSTDAWLTSAIADDSGMAQKPRRRRDALDPLRMSCGMPPVWRAHVAPTPRLRRGTPVPVLQAGRYGSPRSPHPRPVSRSLWPTPSAAGTRMLVNVPERC